MKFYIGICNFTFFEEYWMCKFGTHADEHFDNNSYYEIFKLTEKLFVGCWPTNVSKLVRDRLLYK